jgi:hypothetical protein
LPLLTRPRGQAHFANVQSIEALKRALARGFSALPRSSAISAGPSENFPALAFAVSVPRGPPKTPQTMFSDFAY